MMSASRASTMRTAVAIVLFAVGVVTGSAVGPAFASPSSTAPCGTDVRSQGASGSTWSLPPQAPAHPGQPF